MVEPSTISSTTLTRYEYFIVDYFFDFHDRLFRFHVGIVKRGSVMLIVRVSECGTPAMIVIRIKGLVIWMIFSMFGGTLIVIYLIS